jgi:hypothetical protein
MESHPSAFLISATCDYWEFGSGLSQSAAKMVNKYEAGLKKEKDYKVAYEAVYWKIE